MNEPEPESVIKIVNLNFIAVMSSSAQGRGEKLERLEQGARLTSKLIIEHWKTIDNGNSSPIHSRMDGLLWHNECILHEDKH